MTGEDMKDREENTKRLILTGMMTAVVCVLSILEIPMPTGVPITLQTFALALCGYLLGWKGGLGATLLYVLLGILGVPVFAGMSGGVGVLAGFTGGFLWGFPVLGMLAGVGSYRKNAVAAVAWGMAGLAIVHLLGALQYAILSGNSYGTSFLLVCAPYLIKDALLVAGAYIASRAIIRALKTTRLYSHG